MRVMIQQNFIGTFNSTYVSMCPSSKKLIFNLSDWYWYTEQKPDLTL